MHAIDLMHQGTGQVIATWEVDGVLIDPGPESCLQTMLAGRESDDAPRAILLTHIHFDHAGATGAIVERWPDVPVYLHELGAYHMAEPERLVTSATRLYGEEGMKRLWGEVVPVPEENMHVLVGGERLLDGEYRVAYTPGHASHHVSFLHEPSGRAFVGDVAGVTVPPHGYVVAPTPPPDVDVAAWEHSLDTVAGWAPSSLGLTHFGAVEDVERQLAAVREALHAQVKLAGEHDLEGFVAAMSEKLAREAPEVAEAYAQAAPLEHLYLGLDRWRSKQAKAGASG